MEALGVLCLAAAVWNFGSMLWLVFANGDPRGVAMGLWAAWCLGAGVSLIAAAEVLRRLLDMAESLRRMREK